MITTQKQPLPLLTVLMPVYNAEKFLDESIGSILNQTYLEFELLILDDASTDNSLKIIKNYAKEDKRIRVLINKTNQKQAKCRNRLLKNTTTEFIAWMDADDISVIYRLQMQMDFLKQNPDIDVVSSHLAYFDKNNVIIKAPLGDNKIKSVFLLDCAVAGCCIVRMKKIRANKIAYNEDLKSAEDFQYWVDCCPFVNFATIGKVLYKYRIHAMQDSSANIKIQREAHFVIVKNHLLKFNIEIDQEIIKILLNWYDGNFNYQKFKKAAKILEQIYLIKDFYGHTGVDRSQILIYYIDLLQHLCKNSFITNDQKIVKEFFKVILQKYPNDKPFIFNAIYSVYLPFGNKGKLRFVKMLGFLNYLKIRIYLIFN